MPIYARNQAAAGYGKEQKNIIRRYLRQKLPVIQHCYERTLIAQPGIRGTITMDFSIDASGAVTRATPTIQGKLPQEVADCVATVVKSITFPKPDGPVSVTYPFDFKPTGS